MAITLFAVGALLAARMQTSSVRSTTFGKEALLAITAAQTLTEQLKEEPSLGNFGTIIANGGSGPVLLKSDTTPANIQAGPEGYNTDNPRHDDSVDGDQHERNNTQPVYYCSGDNTMGGKHSKLQHQHDHFRELTKGFSLVELMVALAIAGFLGIGLWALMTSQNKTYQTQDTASQMQQNLRAAMDRISRDLLSSGQAPTAWQMTINGQSTNTWYVPATPVHDVLCFRSQFKPA